MIKTEYTILFNQPLRPVYISVQPYHCLYLLADQLQDIPKNDNGQFQKWMVDYSISESQQVNDTLWIYEYIYLI